MRYQKIVDSRDQTKTVVFWIKSCKLLDLCMMEYNRYCAFWRDYAPIAEFVPMPVKLITLPASPPSEFVPIPVKLITTTSKVSEAMVEQCCCADPSMAGDDAKQLLLCEPCRVMRVD